MKKRKAVRSKVKAKKKVRRAAVKKPARKVVKKPARKLPKKPARKLPKKPARKLPKKTTRKLPKKTARKLPKKTARKLPARKLSKKPALTWPKRKLPKKPTRKLPKKPTRKFPKKPTRKLPKKPTRKLPKKPTRKLPKKPKRPKPRPRPKKPPAPLPKPRKPPRIGSTERAALDKRLEIERALTIMAGKLTSEFPDLEVSVLALANSDLTVDGQVTFTKLPKDVRRFMVAVEEAFEAPPEMWISVGLRFGGGDDKDLEEMRKRYARFKGLFQVATNYQRTPNAALNFVTAREKLYEKLKDMTQKTSGVFVRLHWNKDDEQPERIGGEQGARELKGGKRRKRKRSL